MFLGQCVHMSDATQLADVVTGGAIEELELDQLRGVVQSILMALPSGLTKTEQLFKVSDSFFLFLFFICHFSDFLHDFAESCVILMIKCSFFLVV